MSNKYRTHNCNELRIKHVDNDVVLSGWINKKRDHGNLLFIDLRDNYGVTQCLIDKENLNFKELEKTQLETVIKIVGKVVSRSRETVNNEIKTNSLTFLISDGYKNFANMFGYYVEDTVRIFEKISSISSEDWVQKTFQEGKKIWHVLSENSGDMLPIADVLENEVLVLNVKEINLL